ncbi:MAG: hypothetical protein ACYTG6_08680 [Planctomycetota bacterium]|jgi:hypothetical protein
MDDVRKWRGAIVGPSGRAQTGSWLLIPMWIAGILLLGGSIWGIARGVGHAWIVSLCAIVFLAFLHSVTFYPYFTTDAEHVAIHTSPAVLRSPARIAYDELVEAVPGVDVSSHPDRPGIVGMVWRDAKGAPVPLFFALRQPRAFLEEVWTRAPHTRPTADE